MFAALAIRRASRQAATATALTLALASPVVAADDLAAQRQAFAAAYEALRSGERDTVPASLADYPLYPYLEATQLRRSIWREPGDATDLAVIDWLDSNATLPLADDLRADWLLSLPDRGAWERLHAHYRSSSRSELVCHYVHARTRLEPAADVLEAAQALYRHGRSQPDACDPVFAWLDKQGALTPALIVERMELAMDAGQTSLVRYLIRQLPDDHEMRDYANTWLTMRRSASRFINSLIDDGSFPSAYDPIAAEAFNRLSRFDSDASWEAVFAFAKVFDDRIALLARARRDVALGLAYDRDARAIPMFRSVPEWLSSQRVREWRVRSAVYFRDWEQVRTWILAMPADERDDDTWQYWLGRATAATGNSAEAERILAAVSRERSYYGYLAADELGRDYAMNHRPAVPDAAAQRTLRNLPGAQRAREWFALDDPRKARAEWIALIAELDQPALVQAALVAESWDWHEQAIITLARAKYWHDLDIRYPLPWQQAVNTLGQEFNITPEAIWAITRSESLFARDARSGVGARGLMQLMPATARQVARADGLTYGGVGDLYNPDVNLRLGSRYLAELLDRFDGSLALAAAAYNAGPHRVDRWKPNYAVETAAWVENIPFTATRDYVKKVLKHATGFHWQRTRQPMRVTQRLGAIVPDDEDA